jgi:hypothetical protein
MFTCNMILTSNRYGHKDQAGLYDYSIRGRAGKIKPLRELSVAIGDASSALANTQAPGMAWVFFAVRRRFFIPPHDLPPIPLA